MRAAVEYADLRRTFATEIPAYNQIHLMPRCSCIGADKHPPFRTGGTPQIAHMVRSSTPRSLLLIDEFGKGTAPADGIGLVAALLRHLSRAGRNCLFTLHFHEIFRSPPNPRRLRLRRGRVCAASAFFSSVRDTFISASRLFAETLVLVPLCAMALLLFVGVADSTQRSALITQHDDNTRVALLLPLPQFGGGYNPGVTFFFSEESANMSSCRPPLGRVHTRRRTFLATGWWTSTALTTCAQSSKT